MPLKPPIEKYRRMQTLHSNREVDPEPMTSSGLHRDCLCDDPPRRCRSGFVQPRVGGILGGFWGGMPSTLLASALQITPARRLEWKTAMPFRRSSFLLAED